MAEADQTLTMDETTPESGRFSEEEMDSLRVGEEMEQQTLLAGKYENAQELEKAYVELEKKLGGEKPDAQTVSKDESQTEEKTEEKSSEETTGVLDKLWDERESGFTDDTLKELASTNPGELAKSYLKYRMQSEKPQGLSPKDVDTLGVLSDIFSGKRTPFAGAFGGDPAPISRAYEARQARKTREAEREVWVEQMRSPTGEISDVRKDEIYRAKGLSRLGPKGERKAFIPADQPAPDKPDKEVKPTPEVEEGNKQDSIVNTDDHNIRGQANAINEWASGLDYDQRSISQQIADSLNVRMEDVSEQISQLRNQLKTEMHPHVGRPELLIAFGMGLMGQNGVGYIRALEAHNRGRVAAVQTALDRARGLEGGLQDRWLNFLLTGQKAERAAGEKNISALEDILKREISDISAKEAGFQRTLGTLSDLGPASFKSTGGEDLYGANPGPGVIEGGRRSKKMFSDMIKLLKSEPGVYAGLDRTKALKLLKHRAEIAAAKREARQKQKADK